MKQRKTQRDDACELSVVKGMELKLDCKHYIGEKPCAHNRTCDGCGGYDPWRAYILIIKTAAMGDVLRTTPLARALKNKYPGSKITWLTGAKPAPLLRNNPFIDEILFLDEFSVLKLLPRRFDMLISLDKTPTEAGLATLLNASEKRGIGLCEAGTPCPFNPEAEYYFSLGLSDELKFRGNRKTYGEMVFELSGLEPGSGLRPEIYPSEEEIGEAKRHLTRAGVAFDCGRVGIVAGAGGAFANKTPSGSKWAEVIDGLAGVLPKSDRIYVLGGPDDSEKMSAAAGGAARVIPPLQNVRIYAAVLSFMDAIICGDTFALHAATAAGVPAVALFGPTCSQEIDMFDRGAKLVSPAECSPCYKSYCDRKPSCTDLIRTEDIVREVVRIRKNIAN